MNKGHHTLYQYSTVNMKQGSDNEGKKNELDYTRLPQYLSYTNEIMEEQKNAYYLGRFPGLQGCGSRSMTPMP